MKSRYLTIALVLAGVTMAAPAFAGVANAGGGQKTSSKVFDNTYTKYNYVTNVVRNTVYENNTVSNTVNKDVYKDKYKTNEKEIDNGVSVTGTYGTSGGRKTEVDLGSYDSLEEAKADINNNAVYLAELGRGNIFGDDQGHFDSAYVDDNGDIRGTGKRGSGKYGHLGEVTVTDNSTVTSSTTSSTKDKTTSKTDTSVDVSTDTNTSTTTNNGGCSTYDKLTSIKYNVSNNGILIGDTDNFNNAHAAQGVVNKEKHYDRTNTYTIVNTVYETTVVTTTTTNTTTNTTTHTTTHTTTNTTTHSYSMNIPVTVTPIVLDLDGDGKIDASKGNYLPHQADFSENTVLFDFYGDGFPVICEWVSGNDGLLCRPEADGTVKGINLFGSANGYDNGYDELSVLDTDKSGSLEGAELEGLMVWTDTNKNGIADKGELNSLDSLGITSIGVNHDNFVGSYVRNGQSFKSFDWHPSMSNLHKAVVAH